MTLDQAYEMVYADLMNGCGIFRGIYNAKNGSEDFMDGIGFLMEHIAYKAGQYDEFDDLWYKNIFESMRKSIDR